MAWNFKIIVILHAGRLSTDNGIYVSINVDITYVPVIHFWELVITNYQ